MEGFEAVSVGLGTQAFFNRRRALTAHQRALLNRTAGLQLRAEAHRTWDAVGRVTPRGDVRLISAELIDADRDGTVEAVAVFNAPRVKPRPAYASGEPPPGLQMLMVVTLPAAGKPSVLLSLPTLRGLGPDVSEAFRYEIYRLSGGRFIRVLAGAVHGC